MQWLLGRSYMRELNRPDVMCGVLPVTLLVVCAVEGEPELPSPASEPCPPPSASTPSRSASSSASASSTSSSPSASHSTSASASAAQAHALATEPQLSAQQLIARNVSSQALVEALKQYASQPDLLLGMCSIYLSIYLRQPSESASLV